MLNRTNDVCIDSYLFRSNLNAVCAPRDVDDADDDLLKTTSNLSLSALHIFSTDSYQCENLNFWELDSRQSDGYTHTHTHTHPYAHVGKCQDHTMHTCYVGKKIIVKTSF